MSVASIDRVGPGGELDDTALHQEIELLGELIEKVAGADHPLGQAEIDEALQVRGASDGSPAGA
jgi:hypothetical protein